MALMSPIVLIFFLCSNIARHCLRFDSCGFAEFFSHSFMAHGGVLALVHVLAWIDDFFAVFTGWFEIGLYRFLHVGCEAHYICIYF